VPRDGDASADAIESLRGTGQESQAQERYILYQFPANATADPGVTRASDAKEVPIGPHHTPYRGVDTPESSFI